MSQRKTVDRPKTAIEEMGERCLQVVRDHANDTEADLWLIADFARALGIENKIELRDVEDAR